MKIEVQLRIIALVKEMDHLTVGLCYGNELMNVFAFRLSEVEDFLD